MFNSYLDLKYNFDDSNKHQIEKIKNSVYSGQLKRDILKDKDVVKCTINIVSVSETKIHVKFCFKSKDISLCDFADYIDKNDIENLNITYFDFFFESYKDDKKLCEIRKHYDKTKNDVDSHISLTDLGKSYYEKQ